MKKQFVFLTISVVLISGCTQLTPEEKQLDQFITDHLARVEPLQKQSSLAWWEAATTGKAEAYDQQSKLELQIRQIYSNAEEYAYLDQLKKSGQVNDLLLARQLDQLYRAYLANQMDKDLMKKIVALDTEIQKKFSTFRGEIEGKKVTDNQIREILKTETDSNKRRAAWDAAKQVAPTVAADVIRLVKLRNQVARKLGFANYHTFSLTLSELDPKELDAIFVELDDLTRVPFAKVKADADRRLARRYSIQPKEMMPWHYHDPFFQESPHIYDLDLDAYYKEHDVMKLSQRFYAGIGLPVDSVLARSDLYEREGKNPHAFCTDIDRQGDVRILCNLENNEQWMGTQLHELGHAVYDFYHDPEVPYLLREPTHAFTTEAVAMFFGRLSRNAYWMQQMMDLTDAQRAEIETVSRKYSQLQQLVFARWTLVMYNFEKQLYANPDQDLNTLWWQMVKKYQLVKTPAGRNAPDWAAKIHFAVAPCYYHNYMLGELLASQLHNHVVHKILKQDSLPNVSYVNQPKTGKFLRETVFADGNVYSWNQMIKRTTGELLTPKYFAAEFVK
jgi:peptidyl-dipeptidase A